MVNKKGQIGIILFFVILAIVLVLGFVIALLVGAGSYVGDVVTPVFTDLGGDVGGANLSQAGQYSVGTVNVLVQAAPWIIGFSYLVALIGSIVFVLSYSSNSNPMFMGVYFIFMIFLILIAILFSNMYQSVYEGGDSIALKLQSMTIISYLILYSPHIFTIITIVAGIFLFAGKQGETVTSGYPSGSV